jgi:hypothetical protein
MNAAFTMASGNWCYADASLVRRDRFAGAQIAGVREGSGDIASEFGTSFTREFRAWVVLLELR